ncbi:CAP domain-containing protein [Maritalea porphyrae]|uniref:CAP domain-containing protein n=1 Tax=Maritalea porphyrae TaxID=880732 RepID=UPI0022B00B23|nr:CAP domain-containing protein [Maritalea porphyrae]MCZ4273943.1 CAP domain-containing protein [Maritalea porphyrae]
MHKILAIVALLLPLAGCVSATTPLPAGLTASMAHPGAQLDQQEAIGLINQYRVANRLSPLTLTPELNGVATQAAARYAKDGNNNGAAALIAERTNGATLFSAGYTNFAETFSGWRNSSRDAKTLLRADANNAGLAVNYNANSSYGAHWVLIVTE